MESDKENVPEPFSDMMTQALLSTKVPHFCNSSQVTELQVKTQVLLHQLFHICIHCSRTSWRLKDILYKFFFAAYTVFRNI